MSTDGQPARGGSVASDLGVLHRVLVALSAVLVVVVVIATALGWEAITRVRPEWPQIYPYTVAGLAALVTAMILFDRGGRTGILIGRSLAALALVAGAVVDTLVGVGVLPGNDPTGATPSAWSALPSVAIVAMCASVLMLGFASDRWPRVRFWLAVFAGIIALLTLLSYVYGSASLFTGLGMTGTSIVTPVIGLLLIGAAMTARPDRPPLTTLDERYDSGLLWRVLPPIILVPFLPAAIARAVALFEPDPASADAIAQLVTVALLLVIIIMAGGGQSRARRELSSERERLWDSFASTPAATAMVALDGRVLLANAAFGRLLGAAEADLVGRPMADLVADQDRESVAEGLAEVSSGRDGVRLDVQLRRSRSGTVWVDMGAAPVRSASGGVRSVVVQCSDLTDRKHLERVLSDQAMRDPLTGLLNREGMSRTLSERTEAPEAGFVTAVVYADVDDLKQVNDTIGHAAGDDLLREVARRLMASTRDHDIVARVGGDEFLVVTTAPSAGGEPTQALIDRLREELSGPVAVGREIVSLSVSLGAAILDADMASAVARADEAMYADKKRRRASD